MSDNRTIMILDLTGPDSLDLVDAANRLGVRVVASPQRGSSPPLDGAAICVPIDYSSSPATVQQIVEAARQNNVTGITTANEYLTSVVTHAAARLQLPGNDPTLAMAPRNKVVMAGCFDQHEVAAPRTLVFDSPREVEAATNLSFPCVIKPADSSGSRGVSIVQKNEDLAPALIRVQSQPKIYGIEPDKRIVVQDFVAGAEFSVESVTQGGTVTNVCVTRKVTTSGQFRVEIGHNLPAELDVDSERLLLAGATQAVTAVGIRNGVSHTELILTPDRRCFVLEVAARIGAGRIGAMVDQALGINLAEASVRVAIGEKVDTAPRRHSAAASRFVLAPRAGRLVALEGMPPQGPDVMISAVRHTVGSVVSGPESNRCRIAHFVTHGPDELVVSRRADALLQRVAVTVDPVQESSSSTSGHVP